PRMCVHVEVERGQLVEVRIREMHLRRDLFLIFRRDRPLSHPAKALLRLLRPKQSMGSLVASVGD
ncbi:MAG: LysR substrate-binding domain-containing protein, partial [Candidatus Acidiferrales bacterium]